jgi:hypothetical protein
MPVGPVVHAVRVVVGTSVVVVKVAVVVGSVAVVVMSTGACTDLFSAVQYLYIIL